MVVSNPESPPNVVPPKSFEYGNLVVDALASHVARAVGFMDHMEIERYHNRPARDRIMRINIGQAVSAVCGSGDLRIVGLTGTYRVVGCGR